MSCPPPLLELPLHLISMVLAHVHSMYSLASAILSHPLFYQSFRDDKRHITQSILRHQIPPDLIYYADVAFKAKFVDNDRRWQVYDLLWSALRSTYNTDDDMLPHDWCLDWIFKEDVGTAHESLDTLSIASAISNTHWLVEHFCRSFVRERRPLMRELMGGPFEPEGVRPSQAELFRIRRALYRYQIYCNLLFRTIIDFCPGRWRRRTRNSYLQDFFFDFFPPCVNEQLGCIHDYLEEVLSGSFDEVAAHDVEWGAASVDWLARGKRNEHKQAFLTYGLKFLFQLSTSRNYQHRLRLLKSKGLPRTPVALAAHLERAMPWYLNRDIFHPARPNLGDAISWGLGPQERMDLNKTFPGADDAVDAIDLAPFRIWSEAHKDLPSHEICYWPESQYFRKCGYVMWDIAVPWKIDPGFDPALQKRIRDARQRALIEDIERQRGQDQMRWSWKQRASVRDQGGEGYWESELSTETLRQRDY